jgi:hypothetical protein
MHLAPPLLVVDANIKKYIMVNVKNDYISKNFTIAVVILPIKYVVVNVNITIINVNFRLVDK